MLSKRKHEYSTAHFALKCDTLSLFHREMLKTKQTFAGFSSYFPEINIFDAQQKETLIFNSSFCTQMSSSNQMAPHVPTNAMQWQTQPRSRFELFQMFLTMCSCILKREYENPDKSFDFLVTSGGQRFLFISRHGSF